MSFVIHAHTFRRRAQLRPEGIAPMAEQAEGCRPESLMHLVGFRPVDPDPHHLLGGRAISPDRERQERWDAEDGGEEERIPDLLTYPL